MNLPLLLKINNARGAEEHCVDFEIDLNFEAIATHARNWQLGKPEAVFNKANLSYSVY